jgi:signal transduction histidine kinase
MWINIVFGSIAFISLGILIIYKRQIRSICRQLKFIEKNDTNKIISVGVDSKEIKELADDLNDIIKKQKILKANIIRSNNQLKDTITNISHDIRTPLTSMKGYIELLIDCKSDLERERYIKIIESRIDSLQELVEQLFTYVKLQNKSYQLVFEECNINKILYDTIFSFYDDFKNRNIEPTISIPDECCTIWANEVGIRRILQNVIKNTLDHGREMVIIEMKNSEEKVEVTIKNKYNNIDNIDTEKIFDRFYKADASRAYQSTGLGLSIAYELIKCMNGTIMSLIEDDFFVITMEFNTGQKYFQN